MNSSDSTSSHSAGIEPKPCDRNIDWSKLTVDEHCKHLYESHHVFMRKEMPRLSNLLREILAEEGDRFPELLQIGKKFTSFCQDIEMHLMKEERILFPLMRELELPSGNQEFHCGSVQNPIGVMNMEHDDAKAAIDLFKSLSTDYTNSNGGGEKIIQLYAGLQALDSDLRQHMYEENEVLFPRAIALENS